MWHGIGKLLRAEEAWRRTTPCPAHHCHELAGFSHSILTPLDTSSLIALQGLAFSAYVSCQCFPMSLLQSLQPTTALQFCSMAPFTFFSHMHLNLFSNVSSQDQECAWPRSSFLTRSLLSERLPALRLFTLIQISVAWRWWLKTWLFWQKCLCLRSFSLQKKYPQKKHLNFCLSNKHCMAFSLDSNSLLCISSVSYKLFFGFRDTYFGVKSIP